MNFFEGLVVFVLIALLGAVVSFAIAGIVMLIAHAFAVPALVAWSYWQILGGVLIAETLVTTASQTSRS